VIIVQTPPNAGAPAGAGFNAAELRQLGIGAEIAEIFQYVGRYRPKEIELETRLHPFIPDFIPCVGEFDAFLKV